MLQSGPLNASPLRQDLFHRLPPAHYRLLRELGRLADENHVRLYLVGGVVRDLLLNRPTGDLDFAVEGDGIAFGRAVADRYRAGLTVFERFATARLTLPGGQKVDIASTRSESYAQPAVLPNVKPSSLRDDLGRRDFTVNAMALQVNDFQFGLLHDPYGGQRDLRSKTLRILHERSFSDDPTRVFRAVRFMHRFGFRLEPATRRLLVQAAATRMIDRLSGPRLANEVFLLLGERHPERVVHQLVKLRLLRFLHPRVTYGLQTKRLFLALPRALNWWHQGPDASVVQRPFVYLMALLSATAPSVRRSIAKRLQLSSARCQALEMAGAATERMAALLSAREPLRRSRVYRLLADVPAEAMVLALAKSRVNHGTKGFRRTRDRLREYLLRDRYTAIAVRGSDLARLGLKPGPAYKRILDRILEARLDGRISTDHEEREMAERLVNRARSALENVVQRGLNRVVDRSDRSSSPPRDGSAAG
ncbi:MAG TPA: hypothetical protein VFS39_11855 [Nitrospira sp.]|nr:hypothetical protein [Nitrospira sp.]